ncbi:uncharacterized protein PHACADRAFT_107790 [Phanerochaete carnosa HHB-10118-sp]|uniref:Uncharacterized protein n=1 Tax=Phanerochaete carnosa (strain HHB-10118-sp) TaxID=650164 RepID=K5UHK6_PHACS|nr:uncharacterized protein PHACADRAFT_107790 [Phanerochaete carnosa HHB-10118-sp]EKM48996.1 hypothetical protein PHACADRAFT_107790 [Phanerochaete carnosa HHB-10118-sp]
MLIWIKHSLTPQEIRDKIMDSESEFQRRMVAYLESVHIGEFIGKTMTEVADDLEMEKAKNPSRQNPTTTLPKFIPSPCGDDCQQLCTTCQSSMSWWKQFTKTVNKLLFLTNVHSCNKDCKNNKYGTCKSRFPCPILLETQVDPETEALNLKKGEAMLNNFSPLPISNFSGDTDITSLLSGTAIKSVVAYVTDYITKSPLKTHHA